MTGEKTPKRSLFARPAEAWLRMADYFIPETMAGDREASNQARMFLISHTIGPVLGNSVPIALFTFIISRMLLRNTVFPKEYGLQ